jgi:hypothetical protein
MAWWTAVPTPARTAGMVAALRSAKGGKYDGDNFDIAFDKAFNGYMADRVSTIDALGKRYFGADRNFKSNLDRSARRMIRSKEGLDDV